MLMFFQILGALLISFIFSRKLETNLKKTVDEIAAVENTIRQLKDAIWEKDAPNKVEIERRFCVYC